MTLEADSIVQVLLRERLRVTALAAAVTRDVHAADDIFQQVVLAALESRAQFRGTDHVLAWALRGPTPGSRLCATARCARCRTRCSISWNRGGPTRPAARLGIGGNALHRCLERLTDSARELLQMRYAEGLTAVAVAERLRRTVDAVYQTLSRIHRALRECVERELGERAEGFNNSGGAAVNPPPDLRLAELFVRYWDDALTPAEAEELEKRLATDPAAREWFQILALQAVAATDMRGIRTDQAERTDPGRAAEPAPPVAEPAPAPETPKPAAARRWSRRRVLGYLGGGVAASVGALALGRWAWPEPARPVPAERSVRLGSVRGDVTVRAADGSAIPTDGPVPAGSTVAAAGPSSSAVLFYPNGTNVALTEDSTVTLGPTDDRLRLDRGVLAADVRPPLVGRPPFALETAEAVLTSDAGFITTLYQAARATEVGVQRGSVNVSAPTGRSFGEVRGGELLTVGPDGDLRKQPIRDTEKVYELKPSRSLIAGWEAGQFAEVEKRPVAVPIFRYDPYHRKHMYQIRSDKQWVHGFFRLDPDSEIVVRYRVRESGRGQVCFCVRTPDVRSPNTGMLEWNGVYEESPPGSNELQTIRVSARAMQKDKDNRHAPKFEAPWIGFLFIFNTYEKDLGLQVAEFRVTPPGPAGGNPE